MSFSVKMTHPERYTNLTNMLAHYLEAVTALNEGNYMFKDFMKLITKQVDSV